MELLVKGKKFYMLNKSKGKDIEIRLFDDLDSSIERIRANLKEEVNSENLELLTVELAEGKYRIQTVPWNIIASKLVK